MSYEEALRAISLDADASVGIWTGVPGQPGSAVPNGAKQYHLVKYTGTHQVGLATAAGDEIGVLQNKPQQPGAAATVAIAGVTNVVSGGVIPAGAYLVPDAEGRAVAAGAGVTSKLRSQGIASGAGQLVPALFI